MAVEVLAQQTRTHVEQRGEPFQEALKKSEEKSTSAKGRGLPKEEGYERTTQEWWEGYDPGMDVDF